MSVETTPLSISLYGPDGVGKSSIGTELREEIIARGEEAKLIGGSALSYWITPELSDELMPGSDILYAPRRTFEEKTRYYEAVTIATYRYMDRLASRGVWPILDSDPYYKRIIWATMEYGPERAEEYIAGYEQRMRDEIGDIHPDLIVEVGLGDDLGLDVASFDILTRLQDRGIVSEWDPSDRSEVTKIIVATQSTWQRVLSHRRVAGGQTQTHRIENAHAPHGQVLEFNSLLAQSLMPVLGFEPGNPELNGELTPV